MNFRLDDSFTRLSEIRVVPPELIPESSPDVTRSTSCESVLENTLATKSIAKALRRFKDNPAYKLDQRSYKIFLKRFINCQEAGELYHDRVLKDRIEHEEVIQAAEQDLSNLIAFSEQFKSNNIVQERVTFMETLAKTKVERTNLLKTFHNELKNHLLAYEQMKARYTELNFDDGYNMKIFNSIENYKNEMVALSEKKDKLIEKFSKIYDSCLAQCDMNALQWSESYKTFSEKVLNYLNTQEKAYEVHLDFLEIALNDEHQTLIEKKKATVQLLLEELRLNNKNFNAGQKAKEMHYSLALKRIQKESLSIGAQIFKMLHSKYDNLHREMIALKVDAFQRQEKLEYKRAVVEPMIYEDEIFLNRVKRRLAITNQKISDLKKKSLSEEQKYKVALQKKKKMIDDLHRRLTVDVIQYNSLIKNSHQNFFKIWKLYHDDALDVLQKVLSASKTLSETILLIPWEQPSLEAVSEKEFPFSSSKLVPLSEKPGAPRKKQRNRKANDLNKDKLSEMRLLRNVIRFIPDRSKDLIPSKVSSLLGRYPSDVKQLITVQDFISLFQISDLDELKILTKHFRSYDPSNVKPHLLYAALRDFTEARQRSLETLNIKADPTLNPNKALPSVDDIEYFWGKFYNIIPKDTHKFHKILQHTLKHYLLNLQKREDLIQKCEKLKKLNSELKFLLRNHLH